VARTFSQLGRELHSRVRRMFDLSLDADATPLEIVQAVMDAVERKVEPLGRGRRTFPYSGVVIRVAHPTRDRPSLEAAFAGMGERLLARLAEVRCELPQPFDVKVIVLRKVPSDWPAGQVFAIEYRPAADQAGTPQADGAPAVQLTIVKGSAARRSYTFNGPAISIGRTPDPTDDAGRVRRNGIVFLDVADGVTETVGRAHAHLQFDPQARQYRLFDDGSSNGTFIVRDGSTIAVPARDPRGVRVRPGDEILVGRAVIRFAIAP
jgi:pSer/pThr/pTyr-binding forkhead associated (FHA) protein